VLDGARLTRGARRFDPVSDTGSNAKSWARTTSLAVQSTPRPQPAIA